MSATKEGLDLLHSVWLEKHQELVKFIAEVVRWSEQAELEAYEEAKRKVEDKFSEAYMKIATQVETARAAYVAASGGTPPTDPEWTDMPQGSSLLQ